VHSLNRTFNVFNIAIIVIITIIIIVDVAAATYTTTISYQCLPLVTPETN